jgi:hypothetical protein
MHSSETCPVDVPTNAEAYCIKSAGWPRPRQHAEEAVPRSQRRDHSLPDAPRLIGILVGATGGLAFVLANTHSPLDADVSLTLRILAAVAIILLFALGIFARRSAGRQRSLSERGLAKDETSWYGRGFWLIVPGEVVLFLAGFQLLRALGAPPQSQRRLNSTRRRTSFRRVCWPLERAERRAARCHRVRSGSSRTRVGWDVCRGLVTVRQRRAVGVRVAHGQLCRRHCRRDAKPPLD